jgi:3-oxoacyl-[acyl-carrier protein] reductase
MPNPITQAVSSVLADKVALITGAGTGLGGAIEYADRGITVNCICPGGMEPTENTHRMTPAELARIAEAVQGGAPTGRSANVFDVAQLILLLVGPASKNLTGAIIPYDGGYTAR